MKNQYDAVLFDLGNVVFKIHFERCFQFWSQITGKDLREIEAAFVFDQSYAAHETAGISAAEYHIHVNRMIGIDISFDEFVTGWNSIFGQTIPETIELIQDLKAHHKIFAFSNSNQLHRPVWSAKYKDTLALFDKVFCSSQLKLRKPNAEAFDKICKETLISKERFVFIDDLEENIRGGSQFGFSSVLFSDPVASTNKVRSLVL